MAPRHKSNKNNKKQILTRYTFITLFFLLLALAVCYKLVDATIIDAGAWNERARRELSKVNTIAPERGNILASNGNILACNLKVYDIMLDLRHAKVKKLKAIPWESIDSLADSLDRYFPRRPGLESMPPDSAEKYSWHKRLHDELNKAPDQRRTNLRIAAKKTLADFERIRQFPFINSFKGSGTRIPLYKNERNVRIYPYGKMAYRSIGRVNEDATTGEIHGYSGLEKDLDSLLYGIPGRTKKVALTNGIANWTDAPAKRGFDIVTTIDIDIQDMLEQELLRVCEEAKAEWGTAIIMETASGEIKAISNIELLADGTYGEALNRAVMPYEPGSVMKPISLMIAFEDGLVRSVNDMESCAPFQRTSDPHGGGMKSMKQIIEQSSNTGIARVIFRGYARNPEKFHDRLASIGFFEPIRAGIAGEQIPQVRRLTATDSRGNNITMTARHLDLARQAYGYNTMIPPLYTLAYYNAIANKGKLIRPHLLRSLRDETGRDSVVPAGYIRDQVCSPETADKVKQCIREVVWGSHGTARMVQDDRVEIAGKTGTAYPVENGTYNHSKRRYAFCGFFPYAQPKYTCMALVLGPSGTSANRTSGQVVKNMALKLYSRGMLGNSPQYAEQRSAQTPLLAATSQPGADSRLSRELKLSHARRISAEPTQNGARTVPDVKGYDAASAVRILERLGLNVGIRGSGRVAAQSLPKGTAIRRGQRITLTLRQ